MLWKVLLITYHLAYGVVVCELFSVFSIVCITSFCDGFLPQPQETTLKPVVELRSLPRFPTKITLVHARTT